MSIFRRFLFVFVSIDAAFGARVEQEEFGPKHKRKFAGTGQTIINNAENFENIQKFLDLFNQVKTQIQSKGGGSVVCDAASTPRGVAELSALSQAHRQAESDALRAVASEMLTIVVAGLGAAADAGVPGVGAALTAAAKAAKVESQVASLFAASVRHAKGATGKALRLDALQSNLLDVANTFESAESIESRSGANPSLESGVDGVVQTGLESAHEEVVGAHEGGREQTMKSVLLGRMRVKDAVIEFGETLKEAFPSAVETGLREAAWSAAEFIPIFGPCVAAARQTMALVDTTQALMQERSDYFAIKDPIIRSLFRSRDCMLASFLESDADEIARNTRETMDARIEALFGTLEPLHSAITLNHDLLMRLKKTTRSNPSSSSHETAVMSRLTSGYTLVSGTIQPNTTNGDSWLSKKVLKPSAWQHLVDERLLSQITSGLALLAHERMVFRSEYGLANLQRFVERTDSEKIVNLRRA